MLEFWYIGQIRTYSEERIMNRTRFFRRMICMLLAAVMLCASAFAAHAESEVMNVLLLGTDRRSDKGYGLADTMIIASINPAAGSVKLSSIMRDTWVEIDGHGGEKINAANKFGGPELAMQTVNKYFGTDIDKYVLVDMQGFVAIINLIGGISVPVTEQEMANINQQLIWDALDFELVNSEELTQFGESVLLNGNQALAYARQRVSDSDFKRVNRQYNVFKAMFDEVIHYDLLSLLSIANTMFGYVETNLKMDECIAIASSVIMSGMESIEQYRLPADGSYTSGKVNGVWRIDPDFEKNAELLHAFIYGEQA